jgi:hypothetical protein
MAKIAVSGVNKVGNNFYRTQVTDQGDGTFSSTLFRTDSQGKNDVPIAGYATPAGGGPVARSINTVNASAEEQKLLANPNSSLNQVRRDQVRSTEKTFFEPIGTPIQQSTLSQIGGGSGNTASTAGTPDQQSGSNPTQQIQQQKPQDDGVLIYPLGMRGTDQDRIKFTAVEYQASGNLSSGLSYPNRTKTRSGPHVFLPIQASITDSNSVDWQGANLNVVDRELVNLSLDAMKAQTTKDLGKAFEQSGSKALANVVKYGDEVRVALAGEAVGIQNLLGRFGSVLNPNLELLFTGPQLRPFDFTFKMSAREKREADNIKKIIKFFKQNMAPRKTDDNIFLKAPKTFFIEYKLKGGETTHTGINQIKECALLNCAVDYTPLGTYMTYDDGTMVAYTMTLSFQELEPIYSTDYTDHPIGY